MKRLTLITIPLLFLPQCGMRTSNTINETDKKEINNYVQKLFQFVEGGKFDSVYASFDEITRKRINKSNFIQRESELYAHAYRYKNLAVNGMTRNGGIIHLDISGDLYVPPFNNSLFPGRDSSGVVWQFKKKHRITVWGLIKKGNNYKLRIIYDKCPVAKRP